MPPSRISTQPSHFKRPYASRRKREAAKRSTKSPLNKFLLRALAVLVLLLVVTVMVIVHGMTKQQTQEESILTKDWSL